MSAANSAKLNMAATATGQTAAVAVGSASSSFPLYVMIGTGIGFTVWFILVMSIGIPSQNIATFGSKNALSRIGIIPFLLTGGVFLVATYFYMRAARSASQFIPLMIIPLLSLLFSILALYFSLFQVTNRTSV